MTRKRIGNILQVLGLLVFVPGFLLFFLSLIMTESPFGNTVGRVALILGLGIGMLLELLGRAYVDLDELDARVKRLELKVQAQ